MTILLTIPPRRDATTRTTYLDWGIKRIIFEYHSLFQDFARVGRILILGLGHVVHETNLTKFALAKHFSLHLTLVIGIFSSICTFNQLFWGRRETNSHVVVLVLV